MNNETLNTLLFSVIVLIFGAGVAQIASAEFSLSIVANVALVVVFIGTLIGYGVTGSRLDTPGR